MHEVATVCQALEDPGVRLVTLVGPGGIGKTRVAIQTAAQLDERFADGIVFVDLAPITDAVLVVATIAQALRVPDRAEQSLLITLQQILRDKHLLLVLDNCEQVLGAATDIAALLQAAPNVKALLTSRAVVGVYGGHLVEVPPLSYPDIAQLPPLAQLEAYDAVRLFVARAKAVQTTFTVTYDNATAVAAICQRLDGIPLAIELAAARVQLYPPKLLVTRLEQRLSLLTKSSRTLPARQQTLRATLDWSYRLLEPSEQTLFARLGVFVGGCTLEAVSAVCCDDSLPAASLPTLLEVLIAHSLVKVIEGQECEPRFTMLETIREYAVEQLEASSDMEMVRQRKATYYLTATERIEQS